MRSLWTSEEFGAPTPADIAKACKFVQSRDRDDAKSRKFTEKHRELRESVDRERACAPDALQALRLAPVPEDPSKLYWHKRKILNAERMAGVMPPIEETGPPLQFNGSGKEFDHIYGEVAPRPSVSG